MTGREDQRSVTLLDDYSIEMTARDIASLRAAAPLIPRATRVHVTSLGSEELPARVAAAGAVSELGFVPVPHVAARRLRSARSLDELFDGLTGARREHLFVISGDPQVPAGPFADAAALLSTGGFAQRGTREVGVAGYPDGHPLIEEALLWDALEAKVRIIREQQIAPVIVTQLDFDARRVLAWIRQVRDRGIDAPIRVGVAGPATVKRLVSYASRLGVRSTAGVARKYGFSVRGLLGTAGPEHFIEEIGASLDLAEHGSVALHFYPFGGLQATASWVREARGAGRV